MVDVFVEALIEAKALKTEAEWIQYFGIDKTNSTEIGSEKFEFYVKHNCFEKYDWKLYQLIKDDKTIFNAIEDEIRYFSNPKTVGFQKEHLSNLLKQSLRWKSMKRG